MWSFIGFIVFGFIVGLIARALKPGDQSMGILKTTALGIVGSLAGGLIAWLFHGMPENGFETSGWIMAVIGGILVLFIGEKFSHRRAV